MTVWPVLLLALLAAGCADGAQARAAEAGVDSVTMAREQVEMLVLDQTYLRYLPVACDSGWAHIARFTGKTSDEVYAAYLEWRRWLDAYKEANPAALQNAVDLADRAAREAAWREREPLVQACIDKSMADTYARGGDMQDARGNALIDCAAAGVK
jgi:hypothetical protein